MGACGEGECEGGAAERVGGGVFGEIEWGGGGWGCVLRLVREWVSGVHLAKREAADAGSYHWFVFPGIIGTACQQASGRIGPNCDGNWN